MYIMEYSYYHDGKLRERTILKQHNLPPHVTGRTLKVAEGTQT